MAEMAKQFGEVAGSVKAYTKIKGSKGKFLHIFIQT
jgi:hypothetical protein